MAVTVTGIYGTEPDRQSNEALARALGLDMTRWWTATGASYFNHVSKARVLEVVTEAVDANAASSLAALKKDAVVTGAEQTLAGTGWLPAVLRVQFRLCRQQASAQNPCKAKKRNRHWPGKPPQCHTVEPMREDNEALARCAAIARLGGAQQGGIQACEVGAEGQSKVEPA